MDAAAVDDDDEDYELVEREDAKPMRSMLEKSVPFRVARVAWTSRRSIMFVAQAAVFVARVAAMTSSTYTGHFA